LIDTDEGKTLLQAELHKGQEQGEAPLGQKKKEIFEQVVTTIEACFNENFPA
jgi:hypothetical protein